MKKILLLFFAFVASIGAAWADKTFYFYPNVWDANDAIEYYAVYAYGGESQAAWQKLETTVVVNGHTCYQFQVPDDRTGLIFTRAETEEKTKNFEKPDIWNRSNDITSDNFSDNTLFSITGWDDGEDWSTNSENAKKSGIQASTTPVESRTVTFSHPAWDNIHAYTLNPETLGAWPGAEMTSTGNTYTYGGTSKNVYSVTYFGTLPNSIIFNNGNTGDENQTADLPFAESYTWPDGLPTPPVIDASRMISVIGSYGNKSGAYAADLVVSNQNGLKNILINSRTVYHSAVPTADSRIEGVGINDLTSTFMTTLHLEVWAKESVTDAKVVVYSYGWQNATVSLTGGQWNALDIPVSNFINPLTQATAIKLTNSTDGPLGTEYYITDVFFYNNNEVPTLAASVGNVVSTAGDRVTFNVNCFKGRTASTDGITYIVSYGGQSQEFTGKTSLSATTLEITGLTAGTTYEVSITAKDDADKISEPVVLTVVPFISPSEPNTPTIADENIKIIYVGDNSKNVEGLNKYRASDYQADGWTRQALRYDSGNNVELTMAAQDVSDMDYLHLDIYPFEETTMALFVNGTGTNWNGYDLNSGNAIPASKWYSVDIPVTFFTETCNHAMNTLTNMVFCKAVADKNGHAGFNDFSVPYKSFVIGNIYFYKDASAFTLTATADNTTLGIGSTATITTTVKNTDNSDVTSLASITYNSSNTSVLTVSGNIVTAVGSGSATVTVTATYGEVTKTKDIAFNVLLPEPTAPASNWENVLVVFSSSYHQGDVIDNTNPTYGTTGAPFSTVYENVTYPAQVNDHKVVHVNGKGVNGWTKKPTETTSGNAANMEGYYKVHFAVWPTTATKGEVFADNKYTTTKTAFSGLVPGQWNDMTVTIDAASSGFGDKNYIVIYFMKEDGTYETEFYLDHFYLSKLADNELVVLQEDSEGKAVVGGTLNSSNKSQLGNLTAAAIDLTSTTVAAGTGQITTANPNVVYILDFAGADTKAASISGTNNIVKLAEGNAAWMLPLTDVNLSDANGNRIYAGKNYGGPTDFDVTYTRTIAAEKYVTTVVPVATDIPTGIKAYSFTGYTNGTVTFSKVTGHLEANKAYVLYASSAATLTSLSNKGNFELNATPAGTTIEGTNATFKGTYKQIVTDGTQYVLYGNEILRGEGAMIGGFRAYFTGVEPASGSSAAIAIFNDDETTKIATINAEGEILDAEVYDLNGRRVQNPTKGLYIVNGKKVVIK